VKRFSAGNYLNNKMPIKFKNCEFRNAKRAFDVSEETDLTVESSKFRDVDEYLHVRKKNNFEQKNRWYKSVDIWSLIVAIIGVFVAIFTYSINAF